MISDHIISYIYIYIHIHIHIYIYIYILIYTRTHTHTHTAVKCMLQCIYICLSLRAVTLQNGRRATLREIGHEVHPYYTILQYNTPYYTNVMYYNMYVYIYIYIYIYVYTT